MTHINQPLRAALYARVSLGGEDNRSVADQLADLHRWADRDGWTIVTEHSDEVSASRYSTKTRAGWTAVMEAITAGDVDVLALWEVSRATRDRPVYSALINACVIAGVFIATGGKLHDPRDPDDGFLLDLVGAMAVRESAMTSKRVQRAVNARALEGRPNGALPYGYRRQFDPETGKTVAREVDPDTGPVVQEICRRLLLREPAQAIAKDLNRRGIPTHTGAAWRGGNLRVLACRPTYAGLRVLRGEILPDVVATWPALISVEDHHRLVALFADPERDKFRNSTSVKHLLTGLARCGREGCDGRMRVTYGRKPAYSCRVCHKISRLQEPLDEALEKLLVARLQRPDVLAGFTADDGEAKAAAAEAVRLSAKLANARKLVDEDRMSLESFADFEGKWLPKIKEADARSRPKHLPQQLVEMAGADAAAKWAAADVKARRVVLDTLLTVTILPLGNGPRQGRNPLPFNPDGVEITWKSSVG